LETVLFIFAWLKTDFGDVIAVRKTRLLFSVPAVNLISASSGLFVEEEALK
jgi:hypothetical protein